MKKAMILILGLITLLSLGSLAFSQPTETDPGLIISKWKVGGTGPQPVVATAPGSAQPAAPAAVAAPDATAEPPSEGNASEGSESNETGKSEEGGDVTVKEIFEALEKVITDFKGVGVLAGFISLITFLMLILRIKKLNEWLEPLARCGGRP